MNTETRVILTALFGTLMFGLGLYLGEWEARSKRIEIESQPIYDGGFRDGRLDGWADGYEEGFKTQIKGKHVQIPE